LQETSTITRFCVECTSQTCSAARGQRYFSGCNKSVLHETYPSWGDPRQRDPALNECPPGPAHTTVNHGPLSLACADAVDAGSGARPPTVSSSLVTSPEVWLRAMRRDDDGNVSPIAAIPMEPPQWSPGAGPLDPRPFERLNLEVVSRVIVKDASTKGCPPGPVLDFRGPVSPRPRLGPHSKLAMGGFIKRKGLPSTTTRQASYGARRAPGPNGLT